MNTQVEKKLAAIAKRNGLRDDLVTRNSDSMDFHEVSVWELKAALAEAYEAGRQSVKEAV